MKLVNRTLLATVVAGFLTTGLMAQQDVEIVNRDGEKVSPKAIAVQQDADNRAGVTIQNGDGKITIVDADGTKREIDVSGAQSIIFNHSVKSVMQDGEKQTQSFGKAIIIGPDGERQEIELGGPINGNQQLDMFGRGTPIPGMMRMERTPISKYMIGVNCSLVPESLSAQLNLETGAGLLVDSVAMDSPASAAGIQKHDILMYADDTQLAKTADLVAEVQRVGEEQSKLSMTVIRGGKEIGIDVAPVERTTDQGMNLGGLNAWRMAPNQDNFDFQFKQFGPGLIVGPDNAIQDDFHQRMQEQMQQMQAEIQKMQEQMQRQLQGIDK